MIQFVGHWPYHAHELNNCYQLSDIDPSNVPFLNLLALLDKQRIEIYLLEKKKKGIDRHNAQQLYPFD